ncbi:DUF6302 family protein [Streptomyces sp. NRRL F-5527]|uniref:DUF6302 family protein n=1 Tax=Streptomyces sp. NRRL F-5527 TaxID=1463862 RepID=UPI000AFE4338|nr:DUF6302 family protein [Streptomyces sp. NRRL F-5527]
MSTPTAEARHVAVATSTAEPLTVHLRPAPEAYDYEHWRNLLADPSVLADSFAVRVHRAPLLAVAVGGPRRGGYLSVTQPEIGESIRRLLLGRPGFWSLRMYLSPWTDTCHVLRWGHEPPHGGHDAVLGRFYGYRPSAITTYLRERTEAG